jgi:hypothetical protein
MQSPNKSLKKHGTVKQRKTKNEKRKTQGKDGKEQEPLLHAESPLMSGRH